MLPVAKNALKSARIDSKIFLKIPRTDETRDSTDEVMELILMEILRTGGDLICVIAYFRVRMGVILPIDVERWTEDSEIYKLYGLYLRCRYGYGPS